MSNDTEATLSQLAACLLGRLFIELDTRDYAQVATCFCVEGLWHRQGATLRGPAEIAAALARRPPTRITLHSISNVVARARLADSADVRFYLVAYRHDGHDADPPPAPAPAPVVAPFVMGLCEAQLRREDDQWRVAELHTGPDYWFKAEARG